MPSLSITDFVPRIQYTATAGQVNFVIPFPFFALTDVAVYRTPVGTLPSDYFNKLIYVTNYSISQNVNMTGIMTLNAPSIAGDIITLVREMPDQRLNYYLPGGSFTADAVNTDFESQVLMIQQNQMYDKIVAPHYNVSATPLQPTPLGGQDIILPVLKASEAWVKDPTNNFITTTKIGVGDSISSIIQQVGHGFNIGEIVYFNGLAYVRGLASNDVEAEVIGIVSEVIDADKFRMTTTGLVSGLNSLIPGNTYFLSNVTPGALTVTQPTTVGHISKPLLISVKPDSGYFFNFRGKINPDNAPVGGTGSRIRQVAHGFTVGNVLYHNGVGFARALADNATTAEAVGIVTGVTDIDTFILTTAGFIESLDVAFTGFIPGATYFLSDMQPGLLSVIEPTIPSHISKPMFIASSISTGYLFNMRGQVIPEPPFDYHAAPINQVMEENQGYITTGPAVPTVLTLPTEARFGSILKVAGLGAGGWKIEQNANQQIHFLGLDTTIGVTGYLQSTQAQNTIELVCVVADLEWLVTNSGGNITIV